MSTIALDKLPFTLQCLPYGVISTPDSEPRCAVAIGDHAIDLTKYTYAGRLSSVSKEFGHIEFDHVFAQVSRHLETSEHIQHRNETLELTVSTALTKHLRRSGLAATRSGPRSDPARSQRRRRAGDMSLETGRGQAAPAHANARFLRLLHQSGALPELLWRDGGSEDS